MKKVFIIHGFEGSPNGGWRPWLMRELARKGIYACALSMPTPEKPKVKEWIEEIERHVKLNNKDQIILIGHSLGVPTILKFLEKYNGKTKISKIVLASGPCEKTANKKLHSFLSKPFNYNLIKSRSKKFFIIHGDNDTVVPLAQAKILEEKLSARLIIVKGGGHLNGSSGCFTLPECLEVIV